MISNAFMIYAGVALISIVAGIFLYVRRQRKMKP